MVVYDPTKINSSDAREAAAHQYQAVLDYAQNRLTAAEFTNLQAEMATANLPADSDLVMNFPNPLKFVDLLNILAQRFVSTQPINPSTIATAPAAFGGNLSVEGDLQVTSNLSVAGNLNAAGSIACTALLATFGVGNFGTTVVEGNIIGGAAALAGGLHVGNTAALPLVSPGDVLSVAGYVETDTLILTAPVADPYATTVPNRSFGEDSLGDLFIKGDNTGAGAEGQGSLTYLNRPAADTGWLNLDHPGVGRVGALGDPLQLPDLYQDQVPPFAGGPLTRFAFTRAVGAPTTSTDPYGPGSPSGPIHVSVWAQINDPALIGIPGAGNVHWFPLYPYVDAAGNFAGANFIGDLDNGFVYLMIGDSELIPGFPAIDLTDPVLLASGDVQIRMFYLRRHNSFI